MTTEARLLWIAERARSGCHIAYSSSFNETTGTYRFNFRVGEVGAAVNGFALQVLQNILGSLDAFTASDRGHRHSCGTSVVNIYLKNKVEMPLSQPEGSSQRNEDRVLVLSSWMPLSTSLAESAGEVEMGRHVTFDDRPDVTFFRADSDDSAPASSLAQYSIPADMDSRFDQLLRTNEDPDVSTFMVSDGMVHRLLDEDSDDDCISVRGLLGFGS